MKIVQLYVYPVKSLAGIALQHATLTRQGIAGDRQWMIVKSNGQFLSQRQAPRLARVKTQQVDNGIKLSASGFGDIELHEPTQDAVTMAVNIWKDRCHATVAAPSANQWITDFLQHASPLKFVHFNVESPRWPYQPARFGENSAKFADAAPYLLTNSASLHALNQHLMQLQYESVTMAHFRPNIVIDGLEAFAEHKLRYVQGDHCQLQLVDHCSRCSMITVDPETGIKQPQQRPFNELASLNVVPSRPRVPAFGVNTRPVNCDGSLKIKVGETLSAVNAKP